MNLASLKLYHYWRSSSSWRVRIALLYKQIPFEAIPINLLDGESESAEHLARNPAGFVPVLEVEHQNKPVYLTESLSIMRFLEEVYPGSRTLFPGDALDHAKQWALAEVINSGIQPIQNPPVVAKYSDVPDLQKKWMQYFITRGLSVYEKLVAPTAGRYSVGSQISIADICLIPQLYSAARFDVSLDEFPIIQKIEQNCLDIDAFQKSHPDQYKPS